MWAVWSVLGEMTGVNTVNRMGWVSRQRYVGCVLMCLFALVPLVGCSGQSSVETSDPRGEGREIVVELTNTYLDPSELTIAVGYTVLFRNLTAERQPLLRQEVGESEWWDGFVFPRGELRLLFLRPGTFTITNNLYGTNMTVVAQ